MTYSISTCAYKGANQQWQTRKSTCLSHKLQRGAEYFVNVDMSPCGRVLVLVDTLPALEYEASTLLLSLSLACTGHSIDVSG